jgi:uncharacterized protein (DUF1330 family)
VGALYVEALKVILFWWKFRKEKRMAAYVIVRVLERRNRDWQAEYSPKTTALVQKHGGKFIVRGGTKEYLEGNGALPLNNHVLKFPSMGNAKAWYNDPDYAPLIKLRQSGSKAELLLVEGA